MKETEILKKLIMRCLKYGQKNHKKDLIQVYLEFLGNNFDKNGVFMIEEKIQLTERNNNKWARQ